MVYGCYMTSFACLRDLPLLEHDLRRTFCAEPCDQKGRYGGNYGLRIWLEAHQALPDGKGSGPNGDFTILGRFLFIFVDPCYSSPIVLCGS